MATETESEEMVQRRRVFAGLHAVGIDWPTIIQWFITYGIPLLIQLLPLILSLFGLGGQTADCQRFGSDWLAAVKAKLPVDKLPDYNTYIPA